MRKMAVFLRKMVLCQGALPDTIKLSVNVFSVREVVFFVVCAEVLRLMRLPLAILIYCF